MVHPHACGELHPSPVPAISPAGSSPRMWGTHPISNITCFITWFIPTHVGNSTCAPLLDRATLVHPHACGELVSGAYYGVSLYGSSPRMWGTQYSYYRHLDWSWFIPTHVGNSVMSIGEGMGKVVHPHACGELMWR